MKRVGWITLSVLALALGFAIGVKVSERSIQPPKDYAEG